MDMNQFGITNELFYMYKMSSLEEHDKLRGQIPYREMFGRTLTSLLSNTFMSRILLIERLIECLKFTLKTYNLNLSHEEAYKLCEDICGISFSHINYRYDFIKLLIE